MNFQLIGRKKAKVQNKHGLKVHTQLISGNAYSDGCYADRNARTVRCELNFWKGRECTANDAILKDCLSLSGDPNWWRDFPGMTDRDACLRKCYAEMLLRKGISLGELDFGDSDVEHTRCFYTCPS